MLYALPSGACSRMFLYFTLTLLHLLGKPASLQRSGWIWLVGGRERERERERKLIRFAPVLPTFALAADAQFYDSSSKIGFAVSTAQNASSTNLLFQLSAPQAAGWGAVGSGTRMDGSLMFVIYASGEDSGTCMADRRDPSDTKLIKPIQ